MITSKIETTDDLLNKVEAIILCQASSYSDLAHHLHRKIQKVYGWVRERRECPPVPILGEIRFWAARKTLAIAASSRPVQMAYREAYQETINRRNSRRRED